MFFKRCNVEQLLLLFWDHPYPFSCDSLLLLASGFHLGSFSFNLKNFPFHLPHGRPGTRMILAFVSLRCIYFTYTSKEDFQGVRLLFVTIFLNIFKLSSHHVLACIISAKKSYLSVLPTLRKAEWRFLWVLSRSSLPFWLPMALLG